MPAALHEDEVVLFLVQVGVGLDGDPFIEFAFQRFYAVPFFVEE
jgi:hypothetical protein